MKKLEKLNEILTHGKNATTTLIEMGTTFSASVFAFVLCLQRNASLTTLPIGATARILTSLGQLGFRRYKEPLVMHFRKEILENHQLPRAKSSLLEFWHPSLEEHTKQYSKKTKETSEDRTDSTYFQYLAKKSKI
jgi:hypothetical protein